MNRTKIPWCDYTWNPIVGCSPASSGCQHCYAAAISKRFGLPWGGPEYTPSRLDEPRRHKKPVRIFVCSMSDMYHDGVMDIWLTQIWAEMLQNLRHHTFIVLTKRPQRMLDHLSVLVAGKIGPYIWIGVTAETQKDADERIPILMEIPASVRFVSVEPCLEEISVKQWPLDWVIAGPETGPGARPCRDEWIDRLANESKCFFDKRKQWTPEMRREFPSPRISV